MRTKRRSGQFRDLCSLGEGSGPFWLGLFLAAVTLAPASAAPTLKEARVSQIVKDVNLLPNQAAPHPAKVSDEVRDGTAVRTGTESRAELTFTDQTLARLGANTIFSFNEGTRNLELGGGAMLLRVPKNSGGARINTAAVTAAITGTTVMLEFHPDSYIKFIILEGTGRIFRKGQTGESVLVHAGQMLIVNPKGKGLPDPVDVDVSRIMKTSLLITGFPPLPSLDLIAREIGAQDESKNEGTLVQTNLVIFGGGTTVSLLDPTQANIVNQANSTESRQAILSPTPTATVTPTPPPPTPPPTPTPTPSKFGALTVITAPDPYIITNQTTIQTDPAITTNGQTDFGKIYRGPTQDGLPSAYLFGTTSAFDAAIGFDQTFQDVNLLPLAVFKFSALDITGNPTITIPAGGTPNLALISVGDITSGPPGGIFAFTGLNSLLLATQAGSITLTSDLSFENIPSLAFYARGMGSNLTLDAGISGTTNLFLGAEGSIISNGALAITQKNNGLSVGLFAAIAAGNAITFGNGLSIVNDNSGGGNLVAGGTIIVTAGGALSAGGDLTLDVLNNGGGHIGTGGNIFLTTGGDLTAGTVSALVNNRDGGTIDNGGDLTFNVGGALNATGDAIFVISNRNDGLGGGMIGSPVVLNVNTTSISTGGLLNLAISANAGGVIPSATLNLTAGNVVASGGIVSLVQCTGFNMNPGPFIQGGQINGDALLNLSLGDVTSGDLFEAIIASNGAGLIGGNALLNVTTIGNLNVQTDIVNDVINTADLSGTTLVPGGTITGDASSRTVVNGNIVATSGTGEFAVLNNDVRALAAGGTIGGAATVFVGANGISTGTLFQPIVNDRNGSVGGDATVTVAVTNDINVGTDTLFTILNLNGDIGGNAIGNFSARNVTSASSFHFQIFNDAGMIGGSANLLGTFSGAITAPDAEFLLGNLAGQISGNASMIVNAGSISAATTGPFFQIVNADAGSIGGSATMDITATSISGDSLFVAILNSVNDGMPNGTIGSNATINFNVSGTSTITNNASLQINGSDSAASAAINLTGGTYNVGGTFTGFMDGSGIMTFTNANINADKILLGVFGANGVLRIGGGSLSANTELQLYASGSNGQIDFVSNVTLGGAGTKTLAGNTITISNNVVVTIGGTTPADVYTGFNGQGIPNANYTGFGGNDSTTGTFAGAGANNPQPLANAPPFTSGPVTAPTRLARSAPSNSASFGSGTLSGQKHATLMHVNSTDQLLALLDTAAPAANGEILIPPARKTGDLNNSPRTTPDAYADRGPAEFRVVPPSSPRRLSPP